MAESAGAADAALPWVGLEQLTPGNLAVAALSSSEALARDARRAAPGDVLFGRLRPWFRKVLRVRTALVCTPELWVLRPGWMLDSDWLYYRLAAPDFIAWASAGVEGTGLPRVPWAHAAAFMLDVPSLGAQRAQVAPLLALDALVRQDEEVAATASALALKRPVAGDLREGARGGAATCRFDALVARVLDTVEPASEPEGTPWFGIEHLAGGDPLVYEWGSVRAATSSVVRFRWGDLLFPRLRPNLRKAVVAPVDGVGSSELLVLRPRVGARAAAYRAGLGGELHARMVALSRGTQMPRFAWEDLAATHVPTSTEADERTSVPLWELALASVPAVRAGRALRDALLTASLVPGALG